MRQALEHLDLDELAFFHAIDHRPRHAQALGHVFGLQPGPNPISPEPVAKRGVINGRFKGPCSAHRDGLASEYEARPPRLRDQAAGSLRKSASSSSTGRVKSPRS